MSNTIVLEIVWKLIFFFLNPLFWFSLVAAVLLGYMRVKRERKSFRIRIQPGLTEIKRVLSESWVYAILLSLFVGGIGLVVDPGWLVLFCVFSFIGLVMFNYKIMSPIYFVALSIFTLYGLQKWTSDFTFQGWSLSEVNFEAELFIITAIIAGALLVVEGRLVTRFSGQDASPTLMHTERGLRTAVFKSKRLWLLPVLFIVPGNLVQSYIPYWPQFTLGEQSFTFILIPVVIGFSQIARTMYAEQLMPIIGRVITFLGVTVLMIGVAGLWMPVLSITAIIMGVIIRILISIISTIREKNGSFIVMPRSTGVVIAGVLPNSPSDKMGLIAGETIQSVNGLDVHTEKELYDAIQVNAAYCRLRVIGRDEEVRLVQHVIYHHDHHRLGLLVIR